MYNHTLHHGEKHFYLYCFQTFSTVEKLKGHIKDCIKINGKQKIIMPKKGEYVKFYNHEKNEVTIHNLCRFQRYFSVKR